jgi:hypothetical protein
MTSFARGCFSEVLRAGAPLVVVVIGCGVLLRFPPAQNSFYLRCPIHEFLHVQCPGCGATRALAALLRGHFSEAMHFNALTTLLMPIALVYGFGWYCRFVRREVDHWPQMPGVVIYAILAATVMFAVVRNLPLAR